MSFRNCFQFALFVFGVLAGVNLNQAGAVMVTTDPPPVTTGLMVELNGETLTTAGALSIWQDQANDGNAGSFQNYVQATAARQPTVVLDDPMPNGLTANVVRFDRAASGTNSSSTNSDYLRSVSGGVDASTTVGADPAYKFSQFTYFVVFQSTLTPALSGDNRDRQIIIEANHTGASATWVTQTLQAGFDADGNINAAGSTPDLYNAVRDDPVTLGQVGRGVPDSIQNRWYIAATSWNTTSQDTRIVIRDALGNVLDKSFMIATSFSSGLADHIMTTIGAHSSGSSTPSTSTGQGLTGGIAELLMYNTAMSNADMDAVLDYLNNKYFVSIPGDYDHNGVVQQADYDTWRAAFDSTATPAGSGADGDGNGFVDAADYVIWRKNLPTGSGLGSSAEVPEPASIVLAALCVMLMGSRHRGL